MKAPNNKEINTIKMSINSYQDEKELKVFFYFQKNINLMFVMLVILYRIITLRPTISYVTFKITIVLCWLNY